jgi:hypothetical protein
MKNVVCFLGAFLFVALRSADESFAKGIPPTPPFVQAELNALSDCAVHTKTRAGGPTESFDFCSARVTWAPDGAAMVKACLMEKRFVRTAPLLPPIKGKPAPPQAPYRFMYYCPERIGGDLFVDMTPLTNSRWKMEIHFFAPL